MENKYYTPTLEEFHSGFEYEEETIIYTDKGWFTHKGLGWEKKVFDSTSYMENYYLSERVRRGLVDKYNSTIRVKYLDTEDIESLGFIYDTYFRDGGTSVFNTVDKGYTLYFYRTNTTLDNSNRIKILTNTGPLYRGCLFDGNIKNKSELVKLLKQLGIK